MRHLHKNCEVAHRATSRMAKKDSDELLPEHRSHRDRYLSLRQSFANYKLLLKAGGLWLQI
jgi:hypothetical protein